MQLFSAAMMAPFALPAWPGWAAVEPVAGLLVFHSLTSSVLCLVLWFNGLKRAPAGIAGVFTIFLPATAVALGALWLGEPLGVAHALGFALMAGSLLLATWPRRP
jgi:drug/metabolite transporter (DMT)-like permease